MKIKKQEIKYFQERYEIKTQSWESIIKDYLSERDAVGGVIPLNILNMLDEIIKSNKITGVTLWSLLWKCFSYIFIWKWHWLD